jgi:protein-S-isoprenylcysteine O-methyltransferase Ste14
MGFLNEYFLLTILLISYCLLHSLLISIPVTSFFKRKMGERFSYYRLLFNLFALFSLLPVLYFSNTLDSPKIIRWDGIFLYIQIVLILFGIWIIYSGSKAYNFKQFAGINQIKLKTLDENDIISDNLSTSGISSYIRHPWYSGVIVLLWARNLDKSALIVNIVFTAYLIIGAYWEEKKLVLAFGPGYLKYQKEVSMFFPAKWLLKKLKER